MFESIGDLLSYRARINPNRIGLVFEEREFSYANLQRDARRTAGELQSRGIQRGERFGILDFNSKDVVDLVLGAALMGAVPVLLNWRLTQSEMEFILKDAECRYLFRGDAFAAVEPDRVEIIASGDRAGDGEIASLPEFARGDDLMQLYTSGTTGLPKGVRSTHGNMLALLEQLILELPRLDGHARNLVCAPFFHIAGIGYFLTGLMAGATSILLRRFEPEAAAIALERNHISHALLIPAMQQAIVSFIEGDSRGAGERFPDLVHILYGAAPISRALLLRSWRVFQCDYTQAYGLTETTGVATLLTADDHRTVIAGAGDGDMDGDASSGSLAASAGRGAAGMTIRVLREDGSEAEPGESGEVEVSGPTVMPGYWHRDEENKAVLKGGRLRTGDVGYLDEEGYLFLRDRKKDLIISGGEKVYPIEVERVLMNHPAVRDAAVVGVPHATHGESVCAFIVAGPDEDKEQLAGVLDEWIRPLLPAYRRPRVWRFPDELPRNPSGKVLRRELRAPFWEGRERVIA